MDEYEYQETLSKEEKEKRAMTITVKIYYFNLLERLTEASDTYSCTWDDLINISVRYFLNNINSLNDLRKEILK